MRTVNGWAACAAIVATFVMGAGRAAEIVEENLCDFRPMKFASWMPKEKVQVPITTLYGFRAETAKGRQASRCLTGRWFPAYTASEKVRVSFKYRGTAKKLALLVDMRSANEKPYPGQPKNDVFHAFPLTPKAEWQTFSTDIDYPPIDFWASILRAIVSSDGESFCELADVEIREWPPARPRGRALVLGGVRATEIAILDGQEETRHEEEYRAARMFRYVLYMNGGDYLPIRTAKSLDEIGPNAVLIGAAAEKAGLFTDGDRKLVGKPNSGSCAFRLKGTRLGITGEMPTGIAYGVFACWRELGVEYLGHIKWRAPKPGDFAAKTGFGRAIEPAIAFRGDNCRGDLGSMPELRGRSFTDRTHCTYVEGDPSRETRVDHNMGYDLVRTDEFGKTRPDFFAMRADGSRMTNERPGVTQYCMTNPDLMDLMADRILEMMRLHPESRIFPVSPGDGAGAYCRCPRCAKNTMTDNWVRLLNHIAEKTCKEFPDNYIDMSIYVDNLDLPKTVTPHKNIIGHYCVYIDWPSCLVLDDPVNAEGWRQIHAWRKVFPRLRLVLYPSQCSEDFNMWASVDSDNMMIRDFAENRAMSCRYFGFMIPRAGDLPQTPGFGELRLYVATRIEEDPDYDPVKGAHGFIRDFYGAAAPEISAYYDLFRAEAKRRRWIQNCEQHLKGFVTREFAAKCLPLLDAAEAKVKDDPIHLPAVLHEKQNFLWTYLDGWNRGRGNVSKKDYPEWARRVAEFCRICRDTHIGFMTYGMHGAAKWFKDTCFLEMKGEPGKQFFDLPPVQAVMEDPEKGLGGEYPTLQKEVPGGYEIPAKGFVGAQFSMSSWCRKVKGEELCVRRPSSSLGLAMTRLALKEKPAKDVKMIVCGIDNDHPPIAEMAIVVNGTDIFAGKVPWKKDVWSDATFVIPAALLQAGDNDIHLRNITGDGDEKDGRCGDKFCAQHNYYWGWFAVEKVRFEVGD